LFDADDDDDGLSINTTFILPSIYDAISPPMPLAFAQLHPLSHNNLSPAIILQSSWFTLE